MAASREYRSDDTLRPDLPDAPLANMECCQDDGAEGTAADGDVFGKEERSSPIERDVYVALKRMPLLKCGEVVNDTVVAFAKPSANKVDAANLVGSRWSGPEVVFLTAKKML